MALLAEHVADHHARPLSHQDLRVGSTHAPGATADQYHLAVDPSHDRLSDARRHAKLAEHSVIVVAGTAEGTIACHPLSIRTAGSSTVAAGRRMLGTSEYPMAVWEQAIAYQRERLSR
jgi:hypothetical protein